ncbi:NAD(P)/FAD-dependent oxidoreductase [Planktotalea sp.]|uniref:FAD-dependent oxidoreductase n=1 Tax=Planktotalea sp. TaxID=2029877 RepID=UPI0032999136
MRILIVGAGIAGLTLANLLRQRGLNPVIIEQRSEIKPRGYVLGLWPFGGRVLKGLGLYPKLESVSQSLVDFNIGGVGGQIFHTFQVQKIGQSFGNIQMVRRSELSALLAAPCLDDIRTNLSILSMTQEDAEVQVGFDDGSSEVFDLVVGCDGVGSDVRKMCLPNAQERDTGWSGFGWWTDPSVLPADAMSEYWDAGRKFCALIPAPGALCTFVGVPNSAVPSGDDAALFEGLQAQFGDMGDAVTSAFEARDGSKPIYRQDFRTLSMETWSNGRVMVIGDAASAFFPFGGLGIGGSMAMESAAVLADELSRTDAHFVTNALASFEQRRRPRLETFEKAMQSVVDVKLANETPVPEMMGHMAEMFKSFRQLLSDPI